MSQRLAIWILGIQGCYFLITGLWPLVSIETFQLVTGPKTDHLPSGSSADHWLVNTVAVLVIADALVLLFAAYLGRIVPEVALLAMATALGLMAIDVIYVWRGVIAPIYLLDAALEFVFLAFWLIWLCGSTRRGRAALTNSLADRIADRKMDRDG